MNEEHSAEAEGVARHVLKSKFGVADAKLTRKQGGLANFVFEAITPAGLFVLRIGPAEKRRARFTRERCVIGRVRDAGIPAPEVLDQGEAGDWAYLVLERIAGEPATDHPRRLDIVREASRLAAVCIHRIPTIGFGYDFALEGQCGNGHWSWQAWLDEVLHAGDRLVRLHEHDIVSDEQLETLKEVLDRVRRWTGKPILNHGDLRLKNVLVDEYGKIVSVIDWEHCVSAIGPHWDLSVALHDLSIDQKQAFLDGYGLPAEDVRKFSPVWRLFNAVNYWPVVERYLRRKDAEALEQIRNRFRGALDLYVE